VRGVVLGFDGQRQALDGAQVEGGNLFGVPFFNLDLLLFRRQLGEIEMIRAIDPVDQRQNQKRSLPSHLFAEETHRKHHRSAHHIKGEGPEVAFGPDLVRRFAFGQRNDDRHRDRVGHEENQGGHDQQRQCARAEHPLQIVIGEVRQNDGVRHHAEDVERDLDGSDLLARSRQALHQRRATANHQRFGKIQLEHAQQNEQEVHRHGAVEPGQLKFEIGGEHGDQQVAGKSRQVDTLPVP
jgi:hypothetical protein